MQPRLQRGGGRGRRGRFVEKFKCRGVKLKRRENKGRGFFRFKGWRFEEGGKFWGIGFEGSGGFGGCGVWRAESLRE